MRPHHPPFLLGCDPGLDGAVVLLELLAGRGNPIPTWTVAAVADLREFKNPANLKELEVYRLREELVTWPFCPWVTVEKPGAMPMSQQGVSSAFNFGFTCGGLVGLFGGLGVRTFCVRPAVWKTSMGVPADKRAACTIAAELFPGTSGLFWGERKGPRDGRAEAALLALFGRCYAKVDPSWSLY